MNKEKIFKILMVVYLLMVFLLSLFSFKELIFWKKEVKSKIEVIDIAKLESSLKVLDKRIDSIKIQEVNIDDYSFGARDPF